MNPKIENILVKAPALYAASMRLKPSYNRDKYVFLKLVDRGDIVIDGGANLGYYSCLFSRLAGNKGQVHCFEPILPTYNRLVEKCKNSRLPDNWVLNQEALGDSTKKVTFFQPGEDCGQISIVRHSVGSWSRTTQVTSHEAVMITLNHYAEMKHFKKVDFIKLDLEGAELVALKGADKMLTRWKPILHLEINSSFMTDFGYQPRDILDLLVSFGYTHFLAYEDDPCQLKPFLEMIKKASGNISTTLICTEKLKGKNRLSRLGVKI